MISKGQIQFIRSLEQKRVRDESGCFIAEGDKLVQEALGLSKRSQFQIKTICGVAKWLNTQLKDIELPDTEIIEISERDLARVSLLKTPNQVVSVISRDILEVPEFDFDTELLIGLDQVQDPGNVGTIIRLADWYGLGGVIASRDSADFFSPKVVQASMGSVFRVKFMTVELFEFLQSLPPGYPIYGTRLDGQDLYSATLTSNGLILMGNESKGLSPGLNQLTTKSLFIPDFSTAKTKPESLNVSIAAAIVCSEFRRRGNA
jgi:TrmH family RNA methyltransferase